MIRFIDTHKCITMKNTYLKNNRICKISKINNYLKKKKDKRPKLSHNNTIYDVPIYFSSASLIK